MGCKVACKDTAALGRLSQHGLFRGDLASGMSQTASAEPSPGAW